MTSRREEKERLRQQRLAAQSHEASAARRRLILGYVVAGLLTAAVAAGIVLAVIGGGGGDGDFPEAAHIVPRTGVTEGQASGELEAFNLQPDAREGTKPPPVEQADLRKAAKAAGCQTRLGLRDEGNTHLTETDATPNYRTEPPNSGNHDPSPIADGAYLDTPPVRHYVHSLEHGRIEIQYSPKLPRAQQLALKGLFDEDPASMVMFPNADMPYQVAAAAWTNLLVCKRYDPAVIDAIRAFRDNFRGQGPEFVA
jgi:uncharacterized protein DUF3105